MIRWRRVGLAALGAAAVTSGWWGPWVLRPLDFFEVRRVEVVGARYLTPEAVVRVLALREGASIFDDLDALAQRAAALGGVEESAVQRRLPGQLVVTIREAEPVALAEGPGGLVAVGRDGRPLPYDAVRSPVDAPVVPSADRVLLEALGMIQATDLTLFEAVATAVVRGGEVVLELSSGRIRLALPVDPARVRDLSVVRGDLESRGIAWRELDGRFARWVVVRRAAAAAAGGAA